MFHCRSCAEWWRTWPSVSTGRGIAIPISNICISPPRARVVLYAVRSRRCVIIQWLSQPVHNSILLMPCALWMLRGFLPSLCFNILCLSGITEGKTNSSSKPTNDFEAPRNRDYREMQRLKGRAVASLKDQSGKWLKKGEIRRKLTACRGDGSVERISVVEEGVRKCTSAS